MVDWFSYIIKDIFSYIILWWPWVSLWSDVWFLQLCILYVFFLLIFTSNLYYTLLYLFVEIFYFGIFISIYQMDLFTGFLWVTEATVIFIATLLLLYLNTKGNFNKLNLAIYKYNYFYIILTLLLLSNTYFSELENFLYLNVNIAEVWDNFYEAIYNSNNNDFTALLLSYYHFNSLEFLLLGCLLLIGSLLCVNLFKANYNVRLQKYDNLFNFFSFFKDLINYVFMRKQNLFNQQKATSSTRIFRKKSK